MHPVFPPSKPAVVRAVQYAHFVFRFLQADCAEAVADCAVHQLPQTATRKENGRTRMQKMNVDLVFGDSDHDSRILGNENARLGFLTLLEECWGCFQFPNHTGNTKIRIIIFKEY